MPRAWHSVRALNTQAAVVGVAVPMQQPLGTALGIGVAQPSATRRALLERRNLSLSPGWQARQAVGFPVRYAIGAQH